MTDYFATESGAGLMDGTSPANAWAIDSVDWYGDVRDNTLYILDTVRSFSPNVGGTTANYTTIRGDYPGQPGIVDGDATDTTLISIGVPNIRGFVFRGLTLTNCAPGPENRGMFFNSTADVTIKECTFRDTEQGIAIQIYCQPTGNTTANITITGNTFDSWNDREVASVSNGVCIQLQSRIDDGNYPTDIDIYNNTCTDSQQFFRTLIVDDATAANGWFPRGLRIYQNEISDCERAIQQVRWGDGDGTYKSYVSENIIRNIGTSGDSGTEKLNVIQLEGCDGGHVSENYINTWDKDNGNGDGASIMLDWFDTNANYPCIGVDVYRNIICNGMLNQTDIYTWGPISLYRAKDCDVYSNLIFNCRSAFRVANSTIPANGQGNRIYNNTVYGCTYETIRLDQNAEEVFFRSNLFAHCPTLYASDASAAAPNWDYNAYYKCGAPPYINTHDVTDNPLLGIYAHKSGSPVENAGYKWLTPDDIYGIKQPNPPNIGAYALAEPSVFDTTKITQHARKVIRDAVVLALTPIGLTIRVSRSYPLIDLPVISVFTTSENSNLENSTLGVPHRYSRQLDVEIEIAVEAVDGHDDLVDLYAAKVEATLESDVTLGGAVTELTLQRSTMSLEGAEKKIAISRLTYGAWYRTHGTDPETAL